MKRPIIISALLLLGIGATIAQSTGIDEVLKLIEQNNTELQASRHLTEAQKLTDRTDNNLPDPSINYSYQFGSPQELGKSGELSITQGFDFPTLYSSRNALNKQKAEVLDKQYAVTRRDILQRARELCLDLIFINQQADLLSARLQNAEALNEVYKKRLQTGDANALETNKIRMELMKVRADVTANEADRETKLQELAAMNGGVAVPFAETSYAPVEKLPAYPELRQQVLAEDPALQSVENESLAARKQISVDKQGWLPKLEVGYRRNTGNGEQFNGFIVGGSLPLFSNKGKVKAAKARSLSAELQKTGAEEQAETSLFALYTEAVKLENTLKTYDIDLLAQQEKLLAKALDARQISMTEYYTELEASFQTRLDYLQIENRYQKVIGQIFKNRL